jgi:hypothetical protein
MSNSYTSPPTLSNPSSLVSGQPIKSDGVSRLGDLCNYAGATGGCVNMASQSWALEGSNGVLKITSTSNVTVLKYRVPVLSIAHNTLITYYICEASGASGTVTILADDGATTWSGSNAVASGSIKYLTESVTLSGLADVETVDVDVQVQMSAGGTLRLDAVMLTWSEIASPLNPAQLITRSGVTFRPQGIQRLQPTYPLSSRYGVDLIHNVDMLRQRPRVYLNWSGVFNQRTSGQASRALGIGDIEVLRALVPVFGGTLQNDEFKLYCDLYVEQFVSTFSLNVCENLIEITGNGWVRFELTLNSTPDQASRRWGQPVYQMGLNVDDENLLNLDNRVNEYARTGAGAIISSLMIWGV